MMNLLDLIKSTGLPTILALIIVFLVLFVLKVRIFSRVLVAVVIVIASVMPIIVREVLSSWSDIDLYAQELFISVLFSVSLFISWKIYNILFNYLSGRSSKQSMPVPESLQLEVSSEETVISYGGEGQIREEIGEYSVEDETLVDAEKSLELGADSLGGNTEVKKKKPDKMH